MIRREILDLRHDLLVCGIRVQPEDDRALEPGF